MKLEYPNLEGLLSWRIEGASLTVMGVEGGLEGLDTPELGIAGGGGTGLELGGVFELGVIGGGGGREV